MTNTKSFATFKSTVKPGVQANLPDGKYQAILYSNTVCKGLPNAEGVIQPDYFPFSMQILGLPKEKAENRKLFYPRSIYDSFHERLGAIAKSYAPEFDGDTGELIQHLAENSIAITIELKDPLEVDKNGVFKPSQVRLLYNNEKDGGL